MQFIVQNADLQDFTKWSMSVYDEQEEKLSSIFFLSKPVYDRLGNLYLHVSSENGDNVVDNEAVKLLQKLCKSNSAKFVIGAYSFSRNKSEVNKLFSYFRKRSRYSVINQGILFHREEFENPNFRTTELVLV